MTSPASGLPPSPTGGLLTYKDATFPTPYSATPYGYGAMGNANEWADCSGQITTFFEWHSDGPGDDPPKQVIIRESCSVTWFGYGVSSPATGVADNGLGFAEVSNGPVAVYDGSGNLEYWEGGGDAGGTRYRIEAGKQTVKVTCSPRASTDGGSGGYAEVSLFYGVDVEPLEVNLTGGIGLGNAKRYLIGQQVTATLNSGGLTPTSYNWSVSDGEPFTSWTVAPDWSSTTYVGLGDTTQSSLTFCFKKPVANKATVACSAHLAVPAGAMPAPGFDVTPYRQCRVEPPSSAYGANMGSIMLIPPGNPTEMRLSGIIDPAYSDHPQGIGIRFIGRATTPSDFGPEIGGWNFVQTATPFRSRVNNGISQDSVINGETGLDNGYPYDANHYPASINDVSVFYADNNTNTLGDAPSTDLRVSNGGYLTNPVRWLDEKKANDSFRTWLMYIPPGTGSQFVPIKKIKWFWNGRAIRSSSGTWSLDTPGGNSWGWDYEDGDFPPFPEWQMQISDPDQWTPYVP